MTTDHTTITTLAATGAAIDANSEIYCAAERLRAVLDAGSCRWAIAQMSAVGEVRNAALNAASDDSDSAVANALRRMVRKALHVLGPDALRDVREATLARRQIRRLREMACEALQTGDLARAIAAGVIASAGSGPLAEAMKVRAGLGFMWHLDPDEIIRTQRCSSYNVFCCPQCPDEPSAPIAPIRRAVQ